MNRRRLAISAVAACILVALPTIVALPLYFESPNRRLSSPLLLHVGGSLFFLLAPGLLAYGVTAWFLMLFPYSPGQITTSFLAAVAILTSAAFWTAILYGLLSAYTHLRSRRHPSKG